MAGEQLRRRGLKDAFMNLHEAFRFDEKIADERYKDNEVADADYVVIEDYSNAPYKHYKIRTWRDLNPREKGKELAKTAGKLLASVGILGLSQATLGEPGHDIPDAEFDAKAKAEITQQYLGSTALDQYEMTYLKAEDYTVDLDDGGSGIIGLFTGASRHTYTVGHECLTSTAYNTNPSEIRGFSGGDITAAASLAAQPGGGIGIYPAGSTTPPIVFRYSNRGILLPDGISAETLEAQNCNSSGLPIWEKNNSERFFETIN